MEIPDLLHLGCHEYTVNASEEAAEWLRQNERRGEAFPDKLLIRIDPAGPHTIIAETLLHEMLHICWDHAALNELDQLSQHEEHIVDALTPLILQLLRRNPDLADYLLEEKK